MRSIPPRGDGCRIQGLGQGLDPTMPRGVGTMSLVGNFRTDRERRERARNWFGFGHELRRAPARQRESPGEGGRLRQDGMRPVGRGITESPPNGGWPGSRLRAPGNPTYALPGISIRRRPTPAMAAEAMRGCPGEKEARWCSDHELIHEPSERFGASRRHDQCIAGPAPKTMIGRVRHEGIRPRSPDRESHALEVESGGTGSYEYRCTTLERHQ